RSQLVEDLLHALRATVQRRPHRVSPARTVRSWLRSRRVPRDELGDLDPVVRDDERLARRDGAQHLTTAVAHLPLADHPRHAASVARVARWSGSAEHLTRLTNSVTLEACPPS